MLRYSLTGQLALKTDFLFGNKERNFRKEIIKIRKTAKFGWEMLYNTENVATRKIYNIVLLARICNQCYRFTHVIQKYTNFANFGRLCLPVLQFAFSYFSFSNRTANLESL